VPKLPKFSIPAGLRDSDPNAWSARVSSIFAPYIGGSLPQFYDPTEKATPAGAAEPMISWAAFPAALRAAVPSAEERWKLADADRALQDEYCEWTVEKKNGKVASITFTTEVPEYWDHLAENDPNRLVALYQKHVDQRVRRADLIAPNGSYRRDNRWNTSRPGRLMHLMQANNTLGAAVDLVARATEMRKQGGELVTDRQQLVRCAGLGNPLRNSDPQIASAVNVQAGLGNELTLADPLGLHLGRPLTAGLVTPDGADAADFWKIERGDAQHTLRARFEVPSNKNYLVGDIVDNGRPIKFGGQLADRVQVWIKAVIKPANHQPTPKPCVN